jgi:predicted dienelactone hydrolase
VAGCDGARRLVAPDDPSAPGPWPVGVRTARVGGATVEIWYPAAPGSNAGGERATFDLRDALHAAERRGVAADAPRASCACVRDLPLDEARGPYPVVLFLHGLGLSRAEFPSLCAHWASRGYVVVAPDLPGATLGDVLAHAPRQDEAAAAGAVLDALARPSGDAAFLAGHVDLAHLGLAGHSLGGDVAGLVAARRGAIVITMAERGVPAAKRGFETLVMGGTKDGVEPHARQVKGYAAAPRPKRFVAVDGAGHMSFSENCLVALPDGGWLAAVAKRGLKLDGFPAKLAPRACAEQTIDPARAFAIIAAATTLALDETLACDGSAGAALEALHDRFPEAEVRADR